MRRIDRPIHGCFLLTLLLVGSAPAQTPPPADPIGPTPPRPKVPGALVTPSPMPRADLPGEPTTPAEPDWEKAEAPNEHHARLARLVGKWNVTMSTATAGQEPAEWKGTVEYASILGGRFVTEHAIIDLGGQLFEWHGILGYDNDRKKFTAMWVDNMGTDMELAEGEADPAGGAITFDGRTREPGGAVKRFLWIVTLPETDTGAIEMRLPEEGGPPTVMKMALKREKSAE